MEQQMRERFAAQGNDDPFDLGEVAEADLDGLIRQREHHIGCWGMQRLQKMVAGMLANAREIAGVAELVEIEHLGIHVSQQAPHHRTTNKTGTAGYQNARSLFQPWGANEGLLNKARPGAAQWI